MAGCLGSLDRGPNILLGSESVVYKALSSEVTKSMRLKPVDFAVLTEVEIYGTAR